MVDSEGRVLLNRSLANWHRGGCSVPYTKQLSFELSPGASDDNYNAYNYMVLTCRAKPEAHAKIPAVIHFDVPVACRSCESG